MPIQIISTPGGEAPLAIRQAWVGLVLPFEGEGPIRIRTQGVLTGASNRLGTIVQLLLGRLPTIEGYRVNAATAVELLAREHPQAADWWRSHVAHLLHGQRCFVFEAPCCQRVDHARAI